MSFAKADQLLELAAMVAARHMGVTLAEIEDRFTCSHRTAQRMASALESSFPDVSFTIDEDGRKRWTMGGGHLRELMTLAPDELASLDLAIGQLQQGGLAIEAASLSRLKDKVLALVPRKTKTRIETDHDALLEAQGFVARPGPRPKADQTVLAAVGEAIKACRILEIVYASHGETTSRARRVMPYGLLYGARRYLVGRPIDDAEGPIRTYRLDAVQSASMTAATFVRPDGFDLQAYADRAFGVYQNDGEFGEVCWRFSPDAAEHARGYQFHPDQTMETTDDGSVIVRFRASGHLEMCWHLYAWGDKVEVLAPQELRAMVHAYRRADFPAMP